MKRLVFILEVKAHNLTDMQTISGSIKLTWLPKVKRDCDHEVLNPTEPTTTS